MTHTATIRQKIAAARPCFAETDLTEILPAVEQVLRSGWLILGEYTHEFETRFKEYVGAQHAVAVSSCTAGLQIVLRFYGVEGREVILPTNNFPGVVSAVLYEGGTPVLADMNATTFCVDTDDLLARITSRTAGVIVVHIAGLIYPDIDKLREICEARGLFLVEDASHAHGAAIDGRRAGSLAETACFSFYPTKIMTTVTGGMITTRNADLAAYARSLRHHGQGQQREEFVNMGNDWCMSEIHAILGLHQLKRLDENVDHRNRLVAWYREGLADAEWLTIPTYPPRFRHAYYKLPMLLHEGVDVRQFRRILETEFQIENGTVYDPPCHLQPVFRGRLGLQAGTLPQAERGLRQQFCPPVHARVSSDEVHRVISVMRATIDRCRTPEPRQIR